MAGCEVRISVPAGSDLLRSASLALLKNAEELRRLGSKSRTQTHAAASVTLSTIAERIRRPVVGDDPKHARHLKTSQTHQKTLNTSKQAEDSERHPTL